MPTTDGTQIPNEIRVVCDQVSGHPTNRPVSLLTVFSHIGTGDEGDIENGRWTEHVRSKRVQKELTEKTGAVGSGLTLVGNERWSMDKHGMRPGIAARSVYTIRCPKCGRYPVSVNEPALFAVLNTLRHAGLGEITLRGLAARLSRIDLGLD